jgi:hypothetical protein
MWMPRPPATTRPRRHWIVLAIVAFALVLGLWMYAAAQPTRSARRSNVPAAKVSGIGERESGGSTPTKSTALRAYLRAWEVSWRRWTGDLDRTGGDGLDFSDTPDSTWPRAQRSYQEAAIAYRNEERRLTALSPPSAMRPANDAYMAAVQRQATRFQRLADAFAGTDPATMERRLEALERSQMRFDLDGAQWERAVIAACRASGAKIPEIVRKEYISNGHRTR